MRWMLPHGGARCSWMSFGDLVFGEVGAEDVCCVCVCFLRIIRREVKVMIDDLYFLGSL